MQTVEISGWIFARKMEWDAKPYYTFFAFDPSSSDPSYMKVCEHKIVAEMPADWNPVAAEIAALEAENEKLRAEFSRQIARNMERLAKLTAIEYKPVEFAA